MSAEFKVGDLVVLLATLPANAGMDTEQVRRVADVKQDPHCLVTTPPLLGDRPGWSWLASRFRLATTAEEASYVQEKATAVMDVEQEAWHDVDGVASVYCASGSFDVEGAATLGLEVRVQVRWKRRTGA